MTVTSPVARISYIANGASTVFPVPFYFISNDDLKVVARLPDGTEVPLYTGFTITGAGNEGGGSIAFSSAPAAGVIVAIYRDPALVQTTDYSNSGRFPAESHERTLDRIVMMVQRVSDMCMRGLKLGQTDTDGTGRYRANGNRISGLGDPFDDTDAVNKRYFDAHATNAGEVAEGFANDAAASAANAAASATEASGFATTATVQATSATLAAAAAAASAADAAAIGGFDPALFLLKSGNLSGLANTGIARANLGLATVAATGLYNDLTGKPTFATVATTGAYGDLTGRPSIAAVGLSGAYADLTGKPTLGNAASRNVGTVSGTVAAGDDPRFDQSSKAPLASPAFTGVPTAPTAADGTNNQQIATTAFVMANAGSKTLYAVGTYIFAKQLTGAAIAPGGTTTGANLTPADAAGSAAPSIGGLSMWRCMGFAPSPESATLWLRIS